jgi:hypothetical protein
MPCSRCIVGLAVVGLLVAVTGCQYKWGPVTHPQIRSLAVGTFTNDTRESTASATLRGRIAEAVSTEPGLTLAQPDVADAIIEGRVIKVTQRQVARAKTRQDRDTEHDSDAYQTVLYRMSVSVEYHVRVPGRTAPFIETRQVTGEADMGQWPDQQVYRANALGLALADAAAQIVASVTEAW